MPREDIYSAVSFYRRFNELPCFVRTGNVGFDGKSVISAVKQLTDKFFCFFFGLAVVDRYRKAVFAQLLTDRRAYPA